MGNVRQILRTKAVQTVFSIAPTESVLAAARLMAEKNIGALPVLQGGQPVGIISERNYARRIDLSGRLAQDTAVAEIMDSPVAYVGLDRSREECMALMTEKRLRHLVVMDDGQLVGLISIGDLVKATIADQHFIIEQLEHYINGDRGG